MINATINQFLTKQLPNLKIAVIGDVMVDRYVFGDVSRISPEAPVPVNRVAKMKEVLGGAGNVASNLSNLDCTVYLGAIAGNDDHGDGQRHIAAELLRHAHADGRRDGLGQERDVFLVREAKELAHHEHAAKRCDDTGEDAGKNGLPVLFQKCKLFIQRHGEAHGRGREQVAQILRALVERVVADVRRQKHRNGQHHRDEQRVEECELELFLQQHADAVGSKTDRDAEKDGLFKKCHFFSAPFLPFLSTACVTRPDTAITTIVVTAAMTR